MCWCSSFMLAFEVIWEILRKTASRMESFLLPFVQGESGWADNLFLNTKVIPQP